MLPFFQHLSSSDRSYSAYSNFESEAIVEEVIQQGRKWRVYYDSTTWNARCTQSTTLYPGDIVHVVGIQNITLIVEPVSSFSSNENQL